MNAHQIQIFISHSWNYSNHYDILSDWIFTQGWSVGEYPNKVPIQFIDKSIPKDNPIHNARTAEDLRVAIFNEINNSHIVVIPTGMYASHSNWIQKEIDGAKAYGRPIIAVNPWGQEKKSSVVLENSTVSVGWNKKPVIDAIWGQYVKNYK